MHLQKSFSGNAHKSRQITLNALFVFCKSVIVSSVFIIVCKQCVMDNTGYILPCTAIIPYIRNERTSHLSLKMCSYYSWHVYHHCWLTCHAIGANSTLTDLVWLFWLISVSSSQSALCQFLSKNADRQTPVWMYVDRHWWHTQSFFFYIFLCRIYKFVQENCKWANQSPTVSLQWIMDVVEFQPLN